MIDKLNKLYGIAWKGGPLLGNTTQVRFFVFDTQDDAETWENLYWFGWEKYIMVYDEAKEMANQLGAVNPEWNHEEDTLDFWGLPW